MSLKELTISELLALPSHAPLWVLNNSMNVMMTHTSSPVRPSDVLVDVRRTIVGKLHQSTVTHILDTVSTAPDMPTGNDEAVSRDIFVKPMLRELSIQLSKALRLEEVGKSTQVVVPHDYRGYPFNCTALVPREQLLDNGNFRSAIEKQLLIAITEEDAEWLMSYLDEQFWNQEEPDRHRAFQHLILGVDADEKSTADTLTVCPVNQIRRVFQIRDHQRALAARPWYVKLLAHLRGDE